MHPIIDTYIESLPEAHRIIVFKVIKVVLSCSPQIQHTVKFNGPFFVYKGLFCYYNIDKKRKQVYIGFCDGIQMSNEQNVLEHEGQTLIRKFYIPEWNTQTQQILEELVYEALLIKDEQKKAK